jgi:hypothetical protein
MVQWDLSVQVYTVRGSVWDIWVIHHLKHFSFLPDENIKILSSSYFDLYHAILLTVITLLCMRTPELFFLFGCDFILVIPSPTLPASGKL